MGQQSKESLDFSQISLPYFVHSPPRRIPSLFETPYVEVSRDAVFCRFHSLLVSHVFSPLPTFQFPPAPIIVSTLFRIIFFFFVLKI